MTRYVCHWWDLCTRPTVWLADGGAGRGQVPICEPCADALGLDVIEIGAADE